MGNVLLIFGVFAREQSYDIIEKGITTITQWFGWLVDLVDNIRPFPMENIQVKSSLFIVK